MKKISNLAFFVLLIFSGCASKNICNNKMMQTTLFFGQNIPSGGEVSQKKWQEFLNSEITPRFKDGLSVYDLKGQWLGKDGKIAKENSKAVMIVYKKDKANDEKIKAIKEAYIKKFNQESVMKIDKMVCVEF